MNRNFLFLGVALFALAWLVVLFVFSSGIKGSDDGDIVDSSFAGAKAVDVYLRALNNGSYDKQELVVKKGVPVRLHFSADRDAGCGRALVIYGLNVNVISKSGEENVVSFVPSKEGVFEYNCAMRMWKPGRLVVVA